MRCTGLSNQSTFLLTKQQAGKYISAAELELDMFCPLPFGGLVWHLITQVIYIDLAAYITVFGPRRDKRRQFITFLVYDMVYPSISSNLVILATLSPWYDYVRTHT